MKKSNSFFALATIALLLIIGCKVESDTIEVESITLSTEELTLTRGEKETLTATVTPNNADNKTVIWSSSKKTVAMVENGTVFAISEGTTIITAQAGGKTANCLVTVKPAVESVTLSETRLTLAPGKTEKLTATVTPNDADNMAITWSSDRTDIATVDDYGTVTAQAKGIAIITAQAGNKKATCTVYVTSQAAEEVSISLDKTMLALTPGMTEKLTARVTPNDADNKTVTWRSSNETVATVDNDGTVTAHAEGKATITAQADDITAECEVTVCDHSYRDGKCTVCGAVPYLAGGEIDENGILTKYWYDEATVVIPNGVTGIGDYAFWARNSLTDVTIPGSVTSIGDYAFWSCSSLTNVTIPSSVTSIGANVFWCCNNLKEITFKGTKEQWNAIEGSYNITIPISFKEIPEDFEISITLDKTMLALTPNMTEKLIATVTPNNADDKTVKWLSDNSSVATVVNDGTVTAHAEGTTTIIAQVGDKIATCTVTVKSALIAVESLTLNMTTLTLKRGEKGTLRATVTPDNADNKAITWSSDNPSVATVDNNGTVTACAKGTTIIYARAGNIREGCAVTVEPMPVESVALNKDTLTLVPGATEKLTAILTPVEADDTMITWTSSDSSVAKVDSNGMVTAVKAGTAIISALTGSNAQDWKWANCNVTVKSTLIAVEYVTLNTTTLTLMRGETGKLTATVTPNDADDKTITWSSNNELVAKVDSDGTVTAVKAGTATITATTREGGKTAECEITVFPILVENVTLNKSTLTLIRLKTETLTATVTPSNADNKTVTWSSSDESVATVNSNGKITAVKVGSATITAKAGDIEAKCVVIVSPIPVDSITLNKSTITLTRNDTETLTATVSPSNADNKTVIWSSSDSSVAKVDSTGMVTAVKAGTATITAQAGDKMTECKVTVCIHSWEGGKCTNCGAKPYLENGTINASGVLTKYNGSAATVVIPDGVTSIGEGAFNDCQTLMSVTIPNSVMSIGDEAFYGCVFLKSITIPSGVTSIGNRTFYYCEKFTSVTIPDSVTSIGDEAFYGCGFMSVTIGDGVTSIGNKAFCSCNFLKNVTIPSSVTSIGKDAFSFCNSLTSVTILNGVPSIGDCAFECCEKLTSVTIPNSVTSIGNMAFMSCTSLKSVTIPVSVTSFTGSFFLLNNGKREEATFSECTNLKTVYYGGTKDVWDEITKDKKIGLSDDIIIHGNDGTTWKFGE